MRAAFFDFDQTLLGADSNQLWIEYLGARGRLPPGALERHESYMRDYARGDLDFAALDAFRAQLDGSIDPRQLRSCRQSCVRERLLPVVAPHVPELLRELREQGVWVAVVSASREALVRPVARQLGIDHVIAADSPPGAAVELPCFGAGKVLHVEHVLQGMGLSLQALERSWFYTDSHNDLPLLERVSDPIAVDPDPRLGRIARERGWPVVSWHGAP